MDSEEPKIPCIYCEKDFEISFEDFKKDEILHCPFCNRKFTVDDFVSYSEKVFIANSEKIIKKLKSEINSRK